MVALSNLGNVLAVAFAHARLNQELAKEGILPFSRFFASNKPFNAPAASLFLHWIVTIIVLVAPPAGEAYEFIVDLYTYPGAWINGFVGLGLLWIHFDQWNNDRRGTGKYPPEEDYYGAEKTPPAAVTGRPLKWIPNGWKSPHILTVIYVLANAFLAIVPFIPPNERSTGYPHYVFPIVGVGVLLLGAVYWVLWAKVRPRLGGYKIVAERTVLEDGAEVVRYKKVKTQ